MTDSSTQNSNKTSNSNYSSAQEEEALAELRNLLFSNQPQVEPNSSNQPTSNSPTSAEEALTELRTLLFGADLQQRIDKIKLLAEDVSSVLPEAIILRTMQDEQLSKAIVPTVEQAIGSSVKQDLDVLSDALFPVMGPATRKAVATALKTLTESLNQTLDNSLSPQSFKWRLEALQTGKSFAEVVLLRTLVYRVEQVFLIHKQTSLVLQHVVAPLVAAQDADLVSAMLSAIQSFVQDSFNVSHQDALDTLEFGELTIWIEQGPQAILAGVIRGNAPYELRLVFQSTIEKIHKEFRNSLISFQGDDAPFESSKQYLEDCLQAQYQTKKDKSSPILGILLGTILGCLGIWSFFSIKEHLQWTNFLEKLNSQPGIVVVKAEKRHGKYFISGLRDSLAVDPVTLMQEAKLNPKLVISNWESYISTDSKFTTTRLKRLLQPPATVSLKVDNSGMLYATGSAPRRWIEQAKKQAINFPGVTQVHTAKLIETELEELQLNKEKLESQILYFVKGKTQLLPSEDGKLQAVVKQIRTLSDISPFFHKHIQIEIIGHADSNGSEEDNLRLSQARANAILSTLISQGLKVSDLTAVGVGSRESKQNNQLNRKVSFKVFLTNAPKEQSTKL